MHHETQSQLPTPLDLVAKLLYGSDLRIMEAIRLRVKDIDFPMQQLAVCSGKSDLDHFITLRLAAGRSTLHRLSHRDQASDVASAANHLRGRGSTRSSLRAFSWPQDHLSHEGMEKVSSDRRL